MKGTKLFGIVLLIVIFKNQPAWGQDSLVISEFMALNSSTLQDEDGDFPDWIEIHNPGPAQVNLFGWSLTDNSWDVRKWVFPSVTMDSNEYLVVFASGKDRKTEKSKLHTNFKLSSSGEFLALNRPGGAEYTTAFIPAFPEQSTDISYGEYSGKFIYHSDPTPGSANVSSTYIPAPDFGTAHGFFSSPFDLHLSSDLDSVDIYYTTDASTPDTTNGNLYTSPVNITTTTVVRAIAFKEGSGSSRTKTQSYIFPQDVIHQSNVQPGYPETWIDQRYETEIPGNYSMKEEYVNIPEVNSVIIRSLESLPVVSMVSDIDNFFSRSTHPDSGGIYMYNGAPDGATRYLKYYLGRGWIRPGSVEYFNSGAEDGNLDFQANCGFKIHGGATRTRSKTEKHSFKIAFKSDYGPSKLRQQVFGQDSPDQYDWLILRGGFDRRLGRQIRDPWAKSAVRDMGQYAARSKFVHVYLNGLYWGMYNLSEQMDENCMRDNLGGSADDYDIIKDYYEIEAGDSIAWARLVAMADDNIENNENYQKLLGNNSDGSPNPSFEKMLNPENLIDYIMMNMQAGMTDWDHHNWFAARRRTDSEGFHFLVWDAEKGLTVTDRVTGIVWRGTEERPTGVFSDLLRNASFKDLFISHVNRHFFEGGALTPGPCLERYENWLDEIDTALIADQARWVMQVDDIWNKSFHSFIYSYFPPRTETVFNQFVDNGIYPSIEKPGFNAYDNSTIPKDFKLYMSAPSGSHIRYTTDGTDPGHFKFSEKNSISIYDNQPLTLPAPGETLSISARVKKDSLWSVLVTRQFVIGDFLSDFADEISRENELHIYPNPATGFFNIEFSNPEQADYQLIITDLRGKVMRIIDNISGEYAEIHRDGLQGGVYLLELKGPDILRGRILIE
jgi:hypothetical protein